MEKKLIALRVYRNGPRALQYAAGDVFVASDALMLFLMADAPECFAIYTEPAAKTVRRAPVDKMQRAPKAKK